jgi:plastocyanin
MPTFGSALRIGHLHVTETTVVTPTVNSENPGSMNSMTNVVHTPQTPTYNSATTTRRPARRRIGAIAFVGAAILGACATTSGTQAQAQLGGGSGKTINVGMAKLKFNPKKLEIKKGDSLNFVWKESVAHNVVFDNKGPKSKTLNKGAWLAKMDKAGVYKFKCTLHPGMEGVVAVK